MGVFGVFDEDGSIVDGGEGLDWVVYFVDEVLFCFGLELIVVCSYCVDFFV